MSFCSNCGNPIKAGAKFCSGCGAQMSAPGGGSCPHCHNPVSGSEKFCVHCGAPIAKTISGQTSTPSPALNPPAQEARQASEVQKKKKKGGGLWKTLLIILLLVISGLTALYFLGDEPGNPDTDHTGLSNTDIPGIVSIDDSISGESHSEVQPDTGDPGQAAELVEEAFARADTSQLKQMLTINSQQIYKGVFTEIKPYMSEYSKAFKNRKLRISTPIYALYEFSGEDGKTYTAEFALSDNGQWKLVRF
ncbi:MAG: zinc ribbon domain-containing protein [Bacteroidales bacterium]|jgi:hypothetical protein|nr:zinc ribbon domain-containing protein [Bacteroidales bacterium]